MTTTTMAEAWPTVARHRERAGVWRFSYCPSTGGRVLFGAAVRNTAGWAVGRQVFQWVASVENEDGGLSHIYTRTLGMAARWCLGEYLAQLDKPMES